MTPAVTQEKMKKGGKKDNDKEKASNDKEKASSSGSGSSSEPAVAPVPLVPDGAAATGGRLHCGHHGGAAWRLRACLSYGLLDVKAYHARIMLYTSVSQRITCHEREHEG